MNICFIGGGNMATALIGGLLKGGLYTPAQLRVVEINAESRARLQQEFGVHTTDQIAAGMANSDIVILAVKPQQVPELATRLAPLLDGQLVVSIAAGILTSDLARWLGTQNIVRAMPNTPALITKGASGLYALRAVTPAHKEIAQAILDAVGTSLWLDDEAMMDAVTAVSGSGPAYFFYFIEALEQAGKELGLPGPAARQLALQTALGAASLAHESPEDPAALRARVTSKNGTTERALLSMEANHVKQHIVTAAKAAAARSRELGAELGGGR